MLVCPDCFGNDGLQKRIVGIRPSQPNEKCDYHPSKKGVPIELVSNIIDTVFRENYIGGVDDDSVYNERRGQELEELLYDITHADDHDVIRALIDQLIDDDSYWPPDGEEAFYDEDYRYVTDDYSLGEHSRLWSSFRRNMMHGQRFFNAEARALIERIFENVHQQRDNHKQGPVYMISPGDELAQFFRARIANDEKLRERIENNPAENLGPPPERLRRAGRLNPSGISAFYAAFDIDTCVAELRPVVGSIVTTSQFAITKPICVLDTTRFDAKPKALDIFAPGANRRMAQWRFMQNFMREIGQPISPTDQHLEYIPTQAVAEYLLNHHRFKFEKEERTIDAIVFNSAQRLGGKNIAILGDAAVTGSLANDKEKAEKRSFTEQFLDIDWEYESFPKPVRIVAVPDTLEERRVTGVSFKTEHNHDLYEHE
ncbi:RES family NAD+ phosphorylase [Parasphingorhabdus cellanae]|uniref:RES domain-containing protein n=1 Tax=Parasphingorhabdus cellanae TaxID=2806553 RepID=A0ABX7TA95_9SPHN|nr:RES family NAD+ phosphorylase [Parasphingorhabdus cellanae]QTD57297.1 RES domain-containing protein [Parasphingorhabdus cellanae]